MNKVVVANLKMNLNIEEISEYIKFAEKEFNDKKIIICPTSIYVPYFLKKGFSVGLQNVFHEDKGEFTGEVSPQQASLLGVKYVIIGHSERRRIILEDDEIIEKKVLSSIKNNLGVILCIGETLEEKNMLKTNRVLKRQIVNVLKHVEPEMLNNVVIAYEPLWAIGSGLIPENKDIEGIANYIKGIVLELTGYNDIKVLYGGSVNEKNIKDLSKIKNISGFLVGGASLDPKRIAKIVEEVKK